MIAVIHRGIDYAILKIGDQEFEVNHALATAIQTEIRKMQKAAGKEAE